MKKILTIGIVTIMIGFFVTASLVKADTTPTPSPTTSTMTPTPTIAPTQAVQGSTTVPSGAPKTGFGY